MKRSTALILALLLIVCLGAGGSQAAAAGGGDLPILGSGTITYDPNVPVNNGEDISLSIWTWAYVPWIEQVIEEYTEIHPNVKLELVVSPWSDYFKKLPVALQAGTGPDLFMPHIQYTSILKNLMAPYAEGGLSTEDLAADFRGAKEHVIDGNVYWIDIGDIQSSIIYNRDMWAEAGLTEADIPTTWDQMIEVAKKLTQYDASGNIVVQGFSPNGNVFDLWKDLVYQQGQYLFNAEGTEPIINSPEGEKSAQFIYDLYYEHKLADVKFPEGFQSLGSESAAMIYVLSWVFPELDKNFPDLNYGYFNMPSFTDGTPPAYGRVAGEASFGIPKKSKDDATRAVAFDILRYTLANDDLLVSYNTLQRNVPTKFAIEDAPAIQADECIAGQLKYIDRMVYVGAIPGSYQLGLPKYVDEAILISKEPVAKALATAQEVLTKDMAGQEFENLERTYKYADEMSY